MTFGDRADTSPDESLQVLAAETPVEPPTLPPLHATTAGGVAPTLGADGVTAPWQRRQSRRLGLTPTSTTLTVPEALLTIQPLLRPVRLSHWLRGLSHASRI